ncbi:PREDICTED: mRNAion factor [Prunus dulcis]|uniref:PREDICTED: mRNAion factor n=1 Tax=Prunus dulcis TaxID=3755 RepID=A0A5E4ETL2_PRUDU|nr:transcription factor bHLH95-like [Prunus dulcis]VVA18199.1 PREDICTED: mRNAion factor [Prunus dulcis]
MSEGETGGFSEGFLWENQSWANLSINSDNSGGAGDEDKNLGTKEETAVMGISTEGHNQVPPAPGKKRRGGGGVGKNGIIKGSTSPADRGKGTTGACDGGGGGESDDHEMHIWTERERRKKMRNMFANLHALLPQLPPKADKSTIVDEAVNYIKTLQQTLQKLQKQKLERLQGATTINFDPSILTPQNVAFGSREEFLANHGSAATINPSNSLLTSHCGPVNFQTWTTPNVVLNICGDEAQISVCCPKKAGLLSAICFVLEKYKLGVMSAHVSSDCNRSMYMIQAHARGAPDQFLETFPADEIFKQAAAEIILMLS